MSVTHLIATFFCVGHLRPAPGTWGSAAAIPVAWALHVFGGPWMLLSGIVVALASGWWSTQLETKVKQDHYTSEIVIDEVAGQWLAFLPRSIGAAPVGATLTALYPGWIAAFVLFRLFDIWKPGPIGWADRRGDSLGVMLDDMIAGLFAALGVMALAALSHGVLMS